MEFRLVTDTQTDRRLAYRLAVKKIKSGQNKGSKVGRDDLNLFRLSSSNFHAVLYPMGRRDSSISEAL